MPACLCSSVLVYVLSLSALCWAKKGEAIADLETSFFRCRLNAANGIRPWGARPPCQPMILAPLDVLCDFSGIKRRSSRLFASRTFPIKVVRCKCDSSLGGGLGACSQSISVACLLEFPRLLDAWDRMHTAVSL